MDFHAGGITGVDCSPKDHFCATGGVDGTVRCWDYIAKQTLFSEKWEQGVTKLAWAPPGVDPSGRTVYAGFEDGALSAKKS